MHMKQISCGSPKCANVPSMRKDDDGPTGRAIYEKWGDAALAGYQAVPDLLFKHQTDLKLNTTEMVVLLNVLMHWWYREKKPFPRPTTIARRMGTTTRTVQRAIVRMRRAGLLTEERDELGRTMLDPQPPRRPIGRIRADGRRFSYKDERGGSSGVAQLDRASALI